MAHTLNKVQNTSKDQKEIQSQQTVVEVKTVSNRIEDSIKKATQQKIAENIFHSNFANSEKLAQLGIADKHETIKDVFRRVVDTIGDVENKFSSDSESEEFKRDMLRFMEEKKLIPSTSILMNAGRNVEATLSACAVPPVDLKQNLAKVKDTVDNYHFNGMGTGFNFDDIDDPVEVIEYLNMIGDRGQKNEKQLRPVGNMGVLSMDHPKLIDFINIKNSSLNKHWVFNFSILVDKKNIQKILNKEPIIARDGTSIPSEKLLKIIAQSIQKSGEPGLVFIDRLNEDNQAPNVGEYKSLAPCGEVGLVEGETCQFSYINLGQFLVNGKIDYNELEKVSKTAVRGLDDVLEYNISRYENKTSQQVARDRRKVGVGICGFADLLAQMHLPYMSEEAKQIAEDLISFINYTSKKESVELSKERGAFGGFVDSKYQSQNDIVLKFAEYDTRTISKSMWRELDKDIKEFGIRNCSTIALPPTGRSSYIIGASPSIEPYFSEMLKTTYGAQLDLLSSFQKFTDESISKTINVAESTTTEEIENILLSSIDSNLKGITIYRDKSREAQPEKI